MNIEQIVSIANAISEILSLHIKNFQLIYKNMKRRIPVTTILYNEKYILWIDRYYIAVSNKNTPKVLYIYLSKYHVREELKNVVEMQNKAKSYIDFSLFSNIAKQLQAAQIKMKYTGNNFYLLDNYYDKIRRSC